MINPPCEKCLTVMICKNAIKNVEGNVEFEKTTTKEVMINLLIELALYDKCSLIEEYMRDDYYDHQPGLFKTKSVMKAMNL